jgi:hypothetical protein
MMPCSIEVVSPVSVYRSTPRLPAGTSAASGAISMVSWPRADSRHPANMACGCDGQRRKENASIVSASGPAVGQILTRSRSSGVK